MTGKISNRRGNRGLNDRVVGYYGHDVSPSDIAKIILLIMDNEDRIHPKPSMRGADMIQDYLIEIMNRREFFEPPKSEKNLQ